ncbi:Translin [Atractiella rhizophila]|nr:Translin [Atractiella rhizophila]
MNIDDFHHSLTDLQVELDSDAQTRDALRDVIRPLDRQVRATQTILSKVHGAGVGQKDSILSESEESINSVREGLGRLQGLVKDGEFWKWYDMWKNVVQSASFCVLMRRWLSDGGCSEKEEVASELGLASPTFCLTTEDYLHSLLTLVSELSRLSVNCIPLRDYRTPLKISSFAKDISNGFGLLELRNDSLRRHFDGLKYDNKRCEDVVYDLSLRGLIPPEAEGNESDKKPNL